MGQLLIVSTGRSLCIQNVPECSAGRAAVGWALTGFPECLSIFGSFPPPQGKPIKEPSPLSSSVYKTLCPPRLLSGPTILAPQLPPCRALLPATPSGRDDPIIQYLGDARALLPQLDDQQYAYTT